MKTKFMFAMLMMFFLYAKGWAGTYYVSNLGDNGSNGTSEATAWLTIVHLSNFSAGDNILFNKGDTWREQLDVSDSGSAGSPITYGAYGTGDAPIISGADLMVTWEENIADSDVWYSVTAVTPYVVVFDDDEVGSNHSSEGLSALIAEYDYAMNTTALYIYSPQDPDASSTYADDVEAAQRDFCIYIWTRDYITIDGIECNASNSTWLGAITIRNSADNVTIQNCTVKNAAYACIRSYENGNDDGYYYNNTISGGEFGIYLTDGVNNVIDGNTIHTIAGRGILTKTGSSGNENYIQDNTVYDCTYEGIKVDTGDYNIIRRNTVYNINLDGILVIGNYCIVEYNKVYRAGLEQVSPTGIGGIKIYDGSGTDDPTYGQHNIVRYNHCHDNEVYTNDGGTGINLDFADYTKVYGNICDGNDGHGILVAKSDNNQICNNTNYNNGQDRHSVLDTAKQSEFSIWGDGTTQSDDNLVKNNIFWATQAWAITVWNTNSFGGTTVLDNNCFYKSSGNTYYNAASEHSTIAAWRTEINGDGCTNCDAASMQVHPHLNGHRPMNRDLWSAGTKIWTIDRDYDGNRIRGTKPDIGAFEIQNKVKYQFYDLY